MFEFVEKFTVMLNEQSKTINKYIIQMIYHNHFLSSIQFRIPGKILEIHDYVITDFIILK